MPSWSWFHWIREWSAPAHVTMWTEVQAIATVFAFAAASWYAWIAKRQTEVYREILAVEQTPVLIIDGADEAAHNIGRGPALVAFYRSVEDLRTIGVVLPNQRVPFNHHGLGLSDEKLYYRDTRGAWYATKVILHKGHLYSKFLGAITDSAVPVEVLSQVPRISVAERLGLTERWREKQKHQK